MTATHPDSHPTKPLAAGGPGRAAGRRHRVGAGLTVLGAVISLGLAARTGTLATVAVLGAIVASVALHEAAHLGAARALGVKATEYFVGFGPTLWSRCSGELRWGVKALPVGGYVKLVGMDGSEQVDPTDEPRTFRAQRPGVRAAVAAAGPLANLGIATACFLGLGLASAANPLDGVRAGLIDTRDVLVLSAESVVSLPSMAFDSARDVLGGPEVPTERRVLSPVGATRLADQAVAEGPELVVGLLAVVNAFLGVLNLVPILPFDGGHIAIAAADASASAVSRRRVRLDAARFKPVAVAVVVGLLVMGAASLSLDLGRPVPDPFAAPVSDSAS